MKKFCLRCNCDISFRHTLTKYCGACAGKRNYDIRKTRKKNVGQTRALSRVRYAVIKGILPRLSTQTCVDCGKPAKCYDHRDYNFPLVVEPVCAYCNYHRGPAIPLRSEA